MNATITAKQMKIARIFSLAFMFAAIFTSHFLDFVGFFVIAMAIVLKERKMEKSYKETTKETSTTVVDEDASMPIKLPIRNSHDNNVNVDTFRPTKVTQANSSNTQSNDNAYTRS